MAQRFQFGEFVFDPDTGELRSNGDSRFLQPQLAQLLGLLLESGGALVDRERIEAVLWPAGNIAAEQGINACIREVRRAIGDDARRPTYIETVPRRGYRFVGQVVGLDSEDRDAAATTGKATTPPGRRRWQAVAALLAPVVALVVWAVVVASPDAGSSMGPVVRLAVLALEDLDDDPWNERFAAGLGEALAAELGRVDPERLRIVSATESMRVHDADKPLYVIGEELRADYLVEGSVRRSGDEVQVAVRLVAVGDQAQRWSQQFRGTIDKPLELQAEVARSLAAHLAERFRPAH